MAKITAAAASLTTVPPHTVSYLDIRRDTSTYPRIEAVPRDIAVAAFAKIIFRACFNAAAGGFKDEDQAERISLMAAELYDLCLEDYDGSGTRHLSFAEVARVIRSASVSRDLYGVSVRTLYVAITDYCLGEGHKASKALQAERWASQLPAPDRSPAPSEGERRSLAASLDNLARRHNLNGKI